MLAAVTANCADGSVRPSFWPASVKTSPVFIRGVAGAAASARLVRSVVASGGAAPPTVVSTWLVMMLAPEATGPLAFRLPSISALVVARAVVVVPSGTVMFWSLPPAAMLPSVSTPKPWTNSPEAVTSWFEALSENEPSRV